MKNAIMLSRMLLVLLLLLPLSAAASEGNPAVRIHTSIYQKDGDTNMFTLVLGAAEGHAGKVTVSCSGGNPQEVEIAPAYFDAEHSALMGSYVACHVDEAGIVDVYCDDEVLIDYLSCEGAEITSVEFAHPEAMKILALEHNALESLDLTAFTNLQALYLNDNPFTASPLVVGGNKPNLQIMELNVIGSLDPAFDICFYPSLLTFDAMSTHTLTHVTPSYCPLLKKLSIDNTMVSELDLSQNTELLILNISETRIASIDLSACTKLQQLYATHSSAFNTDVKLESIDLSHCPDLIYLFLNDNRLEEIDLSQCPNLQDLYVRNNLLQSIDLSHCPDLANVMITGNRMDFNTLPVPSGRWLNYEYEQRDLEVPQSHLVTEAIDLSSHVVRDDSETLMLLLRVSDDDPETLVEVDPSKYAFDDGRITFSEVQPDSVFAAFYNATFPDIALCTRMFCLKDAATFGQPEKALEIVSALLVGTPVSMSVGIKGATPEQPKTFYVDLGNGERMECTATTETTPAQPNVEGTKPSFGGYMRVYVEENDRLTAFALKDTKISRIDLSLSKELAELTLQNTQLTALDLQWNRCLKRLDVTGNNFGEKFTLKGANEYFNKNVLSHINLSNNKLTTVTLNGPGSILHLDLGNNSLEDFNFTDYDNLQYLDLSHNRFERLKINYCSSLRTLFCNDNMLSSIVMPETNVVERMDCSGNCLTFVTMPGRNGMDEEHFAYAPQAEIGIPDKGQGYNLSEHDVEIDGQRTVFTWKTSEGETLTEGVDYTCSGGTTFFGSSTVGKTLHCEMTHPVYPALTISTTGILSAGRPTHLLGLFTTPVGGQQVRLSMASAVPDNAVYIDWTGTEILEQYPLDTQYTVFQAVTTEGANVKVWSYDAIDNLSVFSVTGAKMENVDLSGMKCLTALNLGGAGVDEIVLPDAPLQELFLEGNGFSEFDFTRYPDLMFCSLANNKFQTINLSTAPNMQEINLSGNELTDIVLEGNNALWGLMLSRNQLSGIDLSGAPNIEQLMLDHNRFAEIDLSGLQRLHVVYLDHNLFDFSTLPVPQEQWALYTYGGQPELEATCQNGIVDLSSQAERDGVPTEFYWFYGYPEEDHETGELVGDLLVEGEEYDVENGVTTFHASLDKVVGVLYNPLFPRTYLTTRQMSVTAGVAKPPAADTHPAGIYTLGGIKVDASKNNVNLLCRGIYIVNGKKVAALAKRPVL